MKLANQVAIVTGAGRNIGEDVSKLLARNGATIAVVDLDKARGEKVYAANCVACHQANGQGIKGSFPALDGGKITIGPAAGHIDIVLNGKAGTSMAAFGKQLSDTEIAAVVTYERNNWGNKTGTVVQPSDVKAARK